MVPGPSLTMYAEIHYTTPALANPHDYHWYQQVQYRQTTIKGAVPDADLVQSYLQKHLGVPNSQIRNLRDSEATRARRAAILHEINALTTDDRIQRGDPILIFYAGQGSTAPTPKGWESAGPKIQLLLPPTIFSARTKKGKRFMEFQIAPWMYYWDALLPPRVITLYD